MLIKISTRDRTLAKLCQLNQQRDLNQLHRARLSP